MLIGFNNVKMMGVITDMKEVSEKDQLINDALKELDWIAQGGQTMKEFMESYIIIKEALMLLRDED